MTIIAKTPRWLPLAVVALVLYTLVTLAMQFRGPHAPGRTLGPAAPDTASDSVVSRALGQIPPTPIDSTEIKTGWRDEVPGVDLATLAPAQRDLFLRVANTQKCTCGCGFTLAGCRTYDTTCPVSGPRVRALADSVRRGWIASARGLRARPARTGS